MNSIVNLIKKQSLNLEQREKINKILYLSYEKWAIKKALDFKKFHNFKCTNINKQDLILSSKMGLFKSINKYNGNSSFIYFSEIYIKSELFKTLTNHFSLSIIPKNIRNKSKKDFSNQELLEYNKLLQPTYISHQNNWQFNKIFGLKTEEFSDKFLKDEAKLELIKKVWKIVDELKPFKKKIFYLKYDFELNKIKSNKQIAELMCCSEEHIRKNIETIVTTIKNLLIVN
jgi:RNA polymerase sigma factor (sigma-70 family)